MGIESIPAMKKFPLSWQKSKSWVWGIRLFTGEVSDTKISV